mmetsp:Transcript_23782/g.61796  ORF Transcript_23782/g.61796 Transcript_23782/m.61796 type:complete len:297 (-) Transcript_23782:1216-2106(-)
MVSSAPLASIHRCRSSLVFAQASLSSALMSLPTLRCSELGSARSQRSSAVMACRRASSRSLRSGPISAACWLSRATSWRSAMLSACSWLTSDWSWAPPILARSCRVGEPPRPGLPAWLAADAFTQLPTCSAFFSSVREMEPLPSTSHWNTLAMRKRSSWGVRLGMSLRKRRPSSVKSRTPSPLTSASWKRSSTSRPRLTRTSLMRCITCSASGEWSSLAAVPACTISTTESMSSWYVTCPSPSASSMATRYFTSILLTPGASCLARASSSRRSSPPLLSLSNCAKTSFSFFRSPLR